jgi:hypothetical protein
MEQRTMVVSTMIILLCGLLDRLCGDDYLRRTCEALTANGPSRVERGLEVSVNGGELNLRSLNDLQQSFAAPSMS